MRPDRGGAGRADAPGGPGRHLQRVQRGQDRVAAHRPDAEERRQDQQHKRGQRHQGDQAEAAFGAQLLALTPISPFRPRRWRGALLPSRSVIEFRVLEPEKRPVAAVADSFEVRDVARVVVRQSPAHHCTLMFDPEHNLEERILREQFMP